MIVGIGLEETGDKATYRGIAVRCRGGHFDEAAEFASENDMDEDEESRED